MLKKVIKRLTGRNFLIKLAILQKKFKRKVVTEKPVAFLYGFSDWKHKHMEEYLSDYHVKFFSERENFDVILNEVERYRDKVFMVWGYKDRPRVKKLAADKNIPFYRIEDGFVRSVQLGAAKSFPVSMCIDKSGTLYYDSSKPSALENILNTYDFQKDQELLKRAKVCIDLLINLSISKYNHVGPQDIQKIYGKKLKKRILVIGQVEDDESIKRGSAKPITNNELVWLAKMENPDAEIIYKPHPDVLSGLREMQSDPNDVKHIAKVITEPLSLIDAFQTIDHVYTITSLAGFEALLRGIPVTAYGAPFYSGWGLTDDRQEVKRRKRKLTIEEVFAAAYILYPKYMNPITRKESTLEDSIQLIKYMKDAEVEHNNQTDSITLYIGMKESIRDSLSSFINNIENTINIGSDEETVNEYLKRYPNATLFIMEGLHYEALEKHKGLVTYIIPGLVGSAGIGKNETNFSFAFDHKINHGELVNLLEQYDFAANNIEERSKKLLYLIKLRGVSARNYAPVKELESEVGKKSKKRVLIFGVNENSKKRESSNKDIIWLARIEHPEAELIFLPSESELFQANDNYSYSNLDHIAKIIKNPVNVSELVKTADYAYTIDAYEAFEALLYHVPLTTYGTPFYAGWGLTDDRIKITRNRSLSVDEIFTASFILYPKYINPFTKSEITAEQAIELCDFVRNIELGNQKIDLSKEVVSTIDSLEKLSDKGIASKPFDKVFEVQNEKDSKIGIYSKGIKDIPNLNNFFSGEIVDNPKGEEDQLDFIAGWGMKPSAAKAIAIAEKHKIHYLGLEDGFLRSVGLGVDGSPPLSLCVDDVGIYYDATRPSRLENIISNKNLITEEVLENAKKAIELLKKYRLSKYNHAPNFNEHMLKESDKSRVLIIDQTLGDMSISLGLATKETFRDMYQTAQAENPNASIYVKTHPDVISGKKQGNLGPEDVHPSTSFIYDDCNPLTLLEHFDKVYVVTSQMGFEALLLGKEVHCFGMPFYAGWGITKDRQKVERRKVKRSFEEIFAAAYLIYPRYLNPNTGKRGTIFDVIDYISKNKKYS